MSQPQRQLSIGMNILGHGGHGAAWRAGEALPTALTDINYFINIAKISERGTLDAIFLADGPALGGAVANHPAGRLEPTVLLTAVATATSHIGLISTASTTFNEPFNLARRLASVDHVSGGRAAWNLVTTYNEAASKNFGFEGPEVHAVRYERAAEFADVSIKLWDSWEDDAIQADHTSGVFADPGKVHVVNYKGKHFSVRGPLNVPRSPQGRPVIVQAGGSDQGKSVGARYADAIFATQTTLEDGIVFYQDIKNRARQYGRNPDHIKIMPGLSTVIGGTEEEAHKRADYLDSFLENDNFLQQAAQRIGVPVSSLDPDKELPWHLLGDLSPPEKGSHGFFEAYVNLARSEKLTIRQLSRRIRSGHRLVVGTPEQVADSLEQWFLAGAADGFNIMPDVFPSGVESFVDHVVPLLRKKGIFRTEYTGTTLRHHLGLPHPQNQYAQALKAA